MKQKHLLILSLLFLYFISCQNENEDFLIDKEMELTLQPGTTEAKDAKIGSCVQCGFISNNYGNSTELSAIAWTNSGAISNVRGLIEFDLSEIPKNSTITEASLSLFHQGVLEGNIGHSTMSGSNETYLKRITYPWEENTVTWNNQPSTTSYNQVSLPASTSEIQDYIDIDIIDFVQFWVNNPDHNFGMMLILANENHYRSLKFASSDYHDASKHPRLYIKYKQSTSNIE